MDPRNLNALYKYLPLSQKKTSLCANIQYLLDSQHRLINYTDDNASLKHFLATMEWETQDVFSGIVCSFAHLQLSAKECTEPVFVNVERLKEIRNRFRGLILPAYVTLRAGTTNRVVVPACQGIDSWAPKKVYKYGPCNMAHTSPFGVSRLL
jgi:hypothetical protein